MDFPGMLLWPCGGQSFRTDAKSPSIVPGVKWLATVLKELAPSLAKILSNGKGASEQIAASMTTAATNHTRTTSHSLAFPTRSERYNATRPVAEAAAHARRMAGRNDDR